MGIKGAGITTQTMGGKHGDGHAVMLMVELLCDSAQQQLQRL